MKVYVLYRNYSWDDYSEPLAAVSDEATAKAWVAGNDAVRDYEEMTLDDMEGMG